MTKLNQAVSAPAISLTFLATLFYNGPNHSLHWLAVSGLLLFAWISFSLAKFDVARMRLASGWLPLLAIAYALWLFLNPFISTYPYASSITAMQLGTLPLALLGWLILSHDNKQATWRTTWWLLLLCASVLAIWGIGDYIGSQTRAHGPVIDANAYAAIINMFLIPTAFAYLNGMSFGRGVNSLYRQPAFIALLAVAQFMSLSRGALLALCVVLPLLLWLSRKHRQFRWRCPALLGIFLSAYAVVNIAPLGPQRGIEELLFSPAQQLEHDSNIQARFLIWKATWEIIKDSNNFIGTGLGTFKSYYASYRNPAETFSSGNLAHNDYLQALQEGGLIQLSFLLVLVVFAPLWLLFKFRSTAEIQHASYNPDIGIGLMAGLIAISIHSLVNFIQFVAPLAMLTGLYLARSWETIRHQEFLRLHLFKIPKATHVTPAFVKSLIIMLLAIPTAAILLDGAIFKIFAGNDPIINRSKPHTRFVIINTALAIRPQNPMPRVAYINDQLRYAEELGFSASLDGAEHQTKILITSAPGLASGRFLMGKIRAIRGTPDQLLLARADLEVAVKLLPAATGVRLELLKLYRRLEQQEAAYRTIVEARKWVTLEHDYPSLAMFAKEAATVAGEQKDDDTKEYWSWVRSRLLELGIAG